MSRVNDLEAELEMERRIAADNLAAYDAAVKRERDCRVSLDVLGAAFDEADKREARLRAALQTVHDWHLKTVLLGSAVDCICGIALATTSDDQDRAALLAAEQEHEGKDWSQFKPLATTAEGES